MLLCHARFLVGSRLPFAVWGVNARQPSPPQGEATLFFFDCVGELCTFADGQQLTKAEYPFSIADVLCRRAPVAYKGAVVTTPPRALNRACPLIATSGRNGAPAAT
ncbi:hypothetical protein MRX96_029423 [Rhipicephalus microplus]